MSQTNKPKCNKKQLLFFGPNLNNPSHEWMRRMLNGVKDSISSIIVTKGEKPQLSHGLRVVELPHVPPLSDRLKGRLKLNKKANWGAPGMKLVQREIRAPQVKIAFAHFLNFTLPYAEHWSEINKPLFIHCHGYDITWEMKHYDGNSSNLHPPNYVDRVRSLPSSIEFIVNSHESERRLTSIGIAEERIHLKYLGVEVPQEVERIKKKSVQILFLGRLVDCKGPDLTIEAFAAAVARGLQGELIVAGDGPLMMACRLLAHHRGVADKVHFLGSVDSTTALSLMQSSDIFTAHSIKGFLTNQEEAFGVAFVEALASGLPVVTGRSGGISEIIDHNVEGLLFEPGDIDAHANALLNLAEDHQFRDTLGNNGRKRVLNQFTLTQEIARLREILNLPA